MAVPKTVLDLIERFDRNRDTYLSEPYNEAQLRQEFIDPFFRALGWDMDNEQGYAEAYKDVIHEDAIRIGSATKAPDYCFRIGGTRKFFLEAKKPAIKVADDPDPAYQLRRYAWSAKLPLSILTNFDQLAVYDGRIRPSKTDKASKARVLNLHYVDYAKQWESIESIFSRDAVLKGSFDKYAQTSRLKGGTAQVDDAFLAEIESWREILAHNIALRNPPLTSRELNFAVQITIDRIIFLRICEDRGVEVYSELRAQTNGSDLYRRLLALFEKADDRYNSGLFHFRPERDRSELPDELTPGLTIDDKPLREIIHSLYYPECPYEFSVLPAEILGHVYEQFLGKVITLTAGHRAHVEDKPEVKKAGGVYYTPTYIVDYIVKNTVGKLLEGRSVRCSRNRPPRLDRPLRVLDPACGSGSFLLGAYQFLLDWYLDWYMRNDPQQWARRKDPPIRQVGGSPGNGYRLTVAERKRILLDHIFGVDIDTQAVEVTKLSLLLRVLEGEKDLVLFHKERALPDLGNNIKCGNSLIGPDFYNGHQMVMFDDEERLRINALDWEKDGFPEAMKAGGFDAVIGNPPYIRIQTMKEWAPQEVEFCKRRYVSASQGNYDIYVVFVERGLQLLNREGRLGFILPHKFFNAEYGLALRELLSKGKHLSHIVHFGANQVFRGATTYTCLLFLDNARCKKCRFVSVPDLEAWMKTGEAIRGEIIAERINGVVWNFTVGKDADLVDRLKAMPSRLGDLADIFVGLQTSADTVFLFKEWGSISSKRTRCFSKELQEWVELESAVLKPVLRSGAIGRYWGRPEARVLFPYEFIDRRAVLISETRLSKLYPKAWAYLNRNRKHLEEREHQKFKTTGWYQLYPKNLDVWERPKLLVPYMITRLSAFLDTDDLYFVNVTTGGFGIVGQGCNLGLEYLCGLLNSRLLDFYLKRVSTSFRGGYFAANKQFIGQLPVRPVDFSDPADKARHDRMVQLVEQMLGLHRQLADAKTPHEKTALERQITATDSQIDRLVYDLYGLTEEEIRIVEGTTL